MKKAFISSYLKQNLLLLISTGAALCLFLTTSKITVVLEAAIFLLTAFSLAMAERKPLTRNADALILALCFSAIGIHTFYATWTQSGLMATLSGILGLSTPLLVGGIALVGAVAALYAFYTLACWFASLICQAFGPATRKKENLIFSLYSLAFFLILPEPGIPALLYALTAGMVCWMVGASYPSITNAIRSSSWSRKLLSAAATAGICWFRVADSAPNFRHIFLALLAALFVFACVHEFFGFLWQLLGGKAFFRDFSKQEWLLYGILFLLLAGLMMAVFLATDAFYGTEHPYEVIYTSDSPMLVKNNAYLALTYSQNDLRQPLFAVFAAPFLGIFYLLSRLLSASPAWNAILLNLPQLAMLLFAHILLAKLLKLTGSKRMGFVLLSCCTYYTLLFTLMMEQYIVTYFYLILFLYAFCERNRFDRTVLYGAGGTLLTSLILLPLASRRDPRKEWKAWYWEILGCAMGYVLLMIAFCRLDIILGVAEQLVNMTQFTGEKVTMLQKVFQYLSFLPGCFVAPLAEVDMATFGYPSWQLAKAAGVNFAGVGILLLCMLSALWNRDKGSSRMAFGWVLFSLVMLLGLGWGTQENGLILYGLYFGWAFLVLLYQLAEKIGQVLKIRFFLPAVSLLAAAALCAANIPAMAALISFAVSHYPL